MTLWYPSHELRTNGESRLHGTSRLLDTAAAKLQAERYEQGDSG